MAHETANRRIGKTQAKIIHHLQLVHSAGISGHQKLFFVGPMGRQ